MEEKNVKSSGYEGEEKKEKNVSNSKQKRLERQKKAKAAKRENAVFNIIWIAIAVIIVGGIAAIIGTRIYKSSKELVANNNYSAQLADNGFVKGVKATNYVSLCDYKNIVVPLSEVEYTDAQVDEDLNTALENHKILIDEGTIFDGDTVNIDYVGTIDGVAFDGGTAEGSDLTIGSGTFIDDFEQQLIGYKVGETVNVEVTFPDDYATAELAGQDAVFEVVINGVYVLPELTDDFIAEYYSAYATTVDGYRQYLKDTNYEDNLLAYLQTYVTDNSPVVKYPAKYLKSVKETTMYSDQETYEYMNQMYMQYYGYGFNSFEEYSGMTNEEYMAQLQSRAEESCKSTLIRQAILESEGVSVTEDEIKASVVDAYGSEDSYASVVEEYGLGYLASDIMSSKVLEILKGYATVQ